MKAQRAPKIYRYVHVTDDGMAPCVDARMLTLATCKPAIRRTAREGDWVFGFFASPAPLGVVSWAARVSQRKEHGHYERDHRGRSDAVYRENSTGQMVRLRVDYHAEAVDISKDLSGPVLIFDPAATWYFGDQPAQLPEELMHLAASGQGHRVNVRKSGDHEQMLKWLFAIGPAGFYGKPRHGPGCRPCGDRQARAPRSC